MKIDVVVKSIDVAAGFPGVGVVMIRDAVDDIRISNSAICLGEMFSFQIEILDVFIPD